MRKNLRALRINLSVWTMTFLLLALVGCDQKRSGPPFEPAEALKTFRLPPGYRIELVASEPLITDPVEIAFDSQGRLYVAEMEDYPAGAAPGGRIMLLQDNDHNGHFESGNVFAEHLPYVNGVMPWKNGVLVTSAPDILYLEDTTGDGRADIRKVVITGFAFTNPQLRMSSLRYGLDNWIYGAYSRAAGQRGYPEFTNYGHALQFPENPARDSADIYPGNDFRFRPDDFTIEPAGGMSQFGMAFDAAGNRFTVWNNIHLRHVVFDGRYLSTNPYLNVSSVMASVSDHGDAATVYSKAKDRLDLHESEIGHFTSACGHSIYTGGIFDTDYAGAAFICEPVSNIVHADRLQLNGATFIATRTQDTTEFLTSTDSWFRPVNTTVGPDGGLYVVDFYRKLVEHPAWIAHADDKGIYTHAGLLQESDFLDGNDRGRIYRIVPDDFNYATTPKVDLQSADSETLVNYLAHRNMWWRTNAQRLLVDRNDSVAIPALKKLLNDSLLQDGKVHALWTLERLHALNDTLIVGALSDENPVVRKQAVMLATQRLSDPVTIVREKLLEMTNDPDVHVQFQLVLALGQMKQPASFDSLAQIIKQHIADPWFQTAALFSASENSLAWYRRVRSFAISGSGLPSDFLQRITSITGARQRSIEISDLISMISAEKDSAFQLAALKGLEQGLQQGRSLLKIPVKGQKNLLKLITAAPREVAALSLKIGERIFIPPSPVRKKAIEHALKVVLKPDVPVDIRAHQVNVLALDRGPLRKKLFSQLLRDHQPLPVQSSAVNVLLARKDTVSMRLLLEQWNRFTSDVRQRVENSFGNSLPHLNFLMHALEKGQLDDESLSRTTRLRLIQHTNKNIQRRAEILFVDLLDEKREDIVTEFYDATTLKGDLAKGKAIFSNRCSTCHQLGNVGRHFGPDLLSLTNQTRINLLTMIVNPNNEISPGYDGYILETTDGRTYTGVIGNEKAEAIVLRTPDAKEQMIRRRQIRSIKPMSTSLMPDGLESGLSTQDMADLIEFLKNP